MKQTVTLNLTERMLTTPDERIALYFMGATALADESYELHLLYEKRDLNLNESTSSIESSKALNAIITHPLRLIVSAGDVLTFDKDLGNSLPNELERVLFNREVESFYYLKRIQVRDLLPTSVVIDCIYHEQLNPLEIVS